MAQLSSPGVAVTVIDESFYTPAAPGTTPLIIVASAQDKLNGAGDGTAPGTLQKNAGQVYLLTSQKDLSDTFGTPIFQTDASNNPVHAGELNEYGLQAAYSYLGVSNRAFVVRADIDLSQLEAASNAPAGNPANGTYWLDTGTTAFGIFEWDNTTGVKAFTNKVPTVITDANKINNNTGAPLGSIGGKGDYAVTATTATLRVWFKNSSGAWTEVIDGFDGSKKLQISKHTNPPTWKTDPSPAASGSVWIKTTEPNNGARWRVKRWNSATLAWDQQAAPLYDNGQQALYELDRTGGGINLATNTLYVKSNNSEATNKIADFKVYRRSASGATVITSAAVASGSLQAGAYTFTLEETAPGINGFGTLVTVSYTALGTTADAGIIATAINSTVAAGSNIRAEVSATNQLVIKHLKGGDIRIEDKTQPVNSPNQFTFGTLFDIAGSLQVDPEGNDALVYTAISATVGNGGTIAYKVGDTLSVGTGTPATFTVSALASTIALSTVTVTSTSGAIAFSTTNPAMVTGTSVLVTGTDTASSGISPGTYYVKDTTATTATLVSSYSAAISGTGGAVTTVVGATTDLTFVGGAGVVAAGKIATVTLLAEGRQTSGPITAQTTTSSGSGVGATLTVIWNGPETNKYLASLWAPASLVNSSDNPTTIPADGTLWYNSMIDEVDIMVHNGTTWKGYKTVFTDSDPAGPQVSATAPTLQSDGTALVDGDLWISTADIENFPLIYRFNLSTQKWTLLDNSDQTTEEGVLFRDARWTTGPGVGTETGTAASIVALLSSDFLDFDAPDPALYPRGMLLWNLRRSGFNVKEYMQGYVDINADNPRQGDESMGTYYPNRWVSVAANQENGAGTFGRKAQRKVVVQKLQALVNSNQQMRDEESRVFNLIATPGYPELIGEMISLNYDRGLTAFVVGDTPARLAADATTLLAWGTNEAGALEDNDSGLVSSDEYMGVFYPWGFTSDNLGNNVVVPPSHMMLRTIALSDNVSYPWFAPAGTRRGGITNATAVGYVDSLTGEFQSVALNNGQRDTLASIKVNPLTFITGTGLVNYGQYTRARNASALDRINVARLVVFLRRQLSILAKPYIFEPNDKITRDEIKQAAESIMLELVGQRALYDFIVVCDTSNNTPARIDRNELYLDIAIEPVKAVEFIYIPLRLKNTGEIKGL